MKVKLLRLDGSLLSWFGGGVRRCAEPGLAAEEGVARFAFACDDGCYAVDVVSDEQAAQVDLAAAEFPVGAADGFDVDFGPVAAFGGVEDVGADASAGAGRVVVEAGGDGGALDEPRALELADVRVSLAHDEDLLKRNLKLRVALAQDLEESRVMAAFASP